MGEGERGPKTPPCSVAAMLRDRMSASRVRFRIPAVPGVCDGFGDNTHTINHLIGMAVRVWGRVAVKIQSSLMRAVKRSDLAFVCLVCIAFVICLSEL